MASDLFGQNVPGPRPRQMGLGLPFNAKRVDASVMRQLCPASIGNAAGAVPVTPQDEEAIGQRWAAALRARYDGPARAKRIARDFSVEVRTAEGWLEGQAPYLKYLLRGWRRFGAGFVADVIAPASAWAAETALSTELDQLERRLEQLAGVVRDLKDSQP